MTEAKQSKGIHTLEIESSNIGKPRLLILVRRREKMDDIWESKKKRRAKREKKNWSEGSVCAYDGKRLSPGPQPATDEFRWSGGGAELIEVGTERLASTALEAPLLVRERCLYVTRPTRSYDDSIEVVKREGIGTETEV
jgi:hypothetical protein